MRTPGQLDRAKRPYLRSEDRRRHLLDAAARLFDRAGFSGITMVGLATEAGVSRQLVYDHFSDLPTLYGAFVEDRLARYQTEQPKADADATESHATESDAMEAVRRMFRHLLSVPSRDRRIIRLLVADTGNSELDAVRDRFRKQELRRWRRTMGGAPARRGLASTLVWTTVSAFLALADGVSTGALSADDAESLAVAIAESVMPFAALRPADHPRKEPT